MIDKSFEIFPTVLTYRDVKELTSLLVDLMKPSCDGRELKITFYGDAIKTFPNRKQIAQLISNSLDELMERSKLSQIVINELVIVVEDRNKKVISIQCRTFETWVRIIDSSDDLINEKYNKIFQFFTPRKNRYGWLRNEWFVLSQVAIGGSLFVLFTIFLYKFFEQSVLIGSLIGISYAFIIGYFIGKTPHTKLILDKETNHEPKK